MQHLEHLVFRMRIGYEIIGIGTHGLDSCHFFGKWDVSSFFGLLMLKKYLRRLIITNKDAILMEVVSIKELMQLLMKTRNTDEKWTSEEKKEIRRHLRNIVKIIPALVIFTLPGGSFFLPILTEALDRRKIRRR